jgi:Mrp family chromosome partitioning ATPase
LKVVSLGLVQFGEEQPVIWRGPLKMKAIRQLLGETNWGNLDFLIIDSPPGTGDEPLSVCQLIPDIDGAIVVITPQEVAVMDGRKSVCFARQLKVPVVGIIENMSGLICPHCGKEIDLFGAGGGEKAAKEMDVPFLGRIPIEPKLVELEDKGKSAMKILPDDNAAVNAIKEIVGKIASTLGE